MLKIDSILKTTPIELKGVLQLLAGATMISFSGVFVKIAHVGPTMAGFYRMFFGAFILFAIVFFKKEKLWAGRKAFITAIICAIFFALDLSFWHRSIYFVGPGLATLLANFQVFFLTGFGIIVFRESLNLKFLISIPLSILGLLLIVGIKWEYIGADYKTGVIFGLIAAICYSVYLLTLRNLQTKKSSPKSMVNIAIISLFTSLIMGIEAFVQKETFFIPEFKTLTALIAYGLFGQVFGWVLISKGLPKVETSRAGLILLLQPTLAFIWDIIFFLRPTTLVEVIGAIIAMIAIYIGAISQNR